MAKTKLRRNVTFELPPATYHLLQDDAAIRGLDSIHQRGREILIDYLNNQAAAETDQRLSDLEQQLAVLGELIRRLAFSVITHASGKSSKEANEWIQKNMHF